LKKLFLHFNLFLILTLVFFTSMVNAAVGDFDSRQTGNWNNPATWIKKLTGTVTFVNGVAAVVGVGTLFTAELVPGDILMFQASTGTVRGTVLSITNDIALTLTAVAAANSSGAYGKQAVPTSADDVITVAGSDNITVTADATVDQVVWAGSSLTINSGVKLTIADGPGTDLSSSATGMSLIVNGTLEVNGQISAAHTLTINSGGIVNVNAAGTFTVAPGSTIVNVTGTLNVDGTMTGPNTVTINNTGVVNVTGTFNITTGNPTLNVNAGSNLNFTGTGNMSISSTTQMIVDGTVAMSGSSTLSTSRGNSGFTVKINSGGIIDLTGTSSMSISGNANARMDVLSGATLELASGASIIGVGQIRICNGASISIGSVDGITSSGATGNVLVSSTRTYGGVDDAGTVQATNTINFTYNGTANQNTGNGLPASITGSLTINNSGNTVTLNSASATGGSVSLTAGTFATGTNLTMSTTSSITRTAGSMTGTPQGAGLYNVSYTGNSKTTGTELAGSGLKNITLNLAAGQVLTMDQARTIPGTGVLTLTSGILTTTASNLLILNAGATTSPSSNTAYVNGPLRKVFNAAEAFTFPIGVSGTGDEPLGITGAAGGDDFTANYIRGSATVLDPDITAPIINVSGCDYWTLTKNSGAATSVNVTLSWDASSPCNAEPFVTDPASLTVAHYNSSSWEQAGTGGPTYTGTSTAGTVTRTGVSSFSPFALANTVQGQNPLPVRFSNIKATRKNDGIEVAWTNFSETDVDYYTVERSSNGIQFSGISRVLPVLNNGDKADYDFLDPSPNVGINFYRIMLLEVENKTFYSSMVRVNSEGNFSGIIIYPNPIRGSQFVFQSSNLAEGEYNLKIYNGVGQLILDQPFNQIGASVNQTIQLPANAKPGVYSLRLKNGETSLQRIFVIQ
jgi:hypothetical protein